MSWTSFSLARASPRTRRGFGLIGEAVRSRRLRLRISQRQLEAMCGVDQTVISRLENGRLASLRWSRFADLVDALDGLSEDDPMRAWMSRSLPSRASELPPRASEPWADDDH